MCIRYVANSPGDLRTGGASRATPHPALRALEPLASRARSTRRNTPHPAPDNAHNQTAPSGQNEQTCSGWAGGKEHVQSSHASARHSSRARLTLRSEARDTTGRSPASYTQLSQFTLRQSCRSPNPQTEDPRAAPIARRVSCKCELHSSSRHTHIRPMPRSASCDVSSANATDTSMQPTSQASQSERPTSLNASPAASKAAGSANRQRTCRSIA